ncbi:hypothetical protein U1E44_10485 [Arenibacter sp. GZD96]|nr:hypothetical protein [Arenibacter sp. GZD-96]MEA1786518.1 hypothetical protein [Arenibacter sp. GZD-96]
MITIKGLKKSFRADEVETLEASPSPSGGGGSSMGIYILNTLNGLKK